MREKRRVSRTKRSEKSGVGLVFVQTSAWPAWEKATLSPVCLFFVGRVLHVR